MPHYIDPKTDWTVPDIVQTTDLNRIGRNLQTSRIGGGETSLPVVSVDSSYGLPIDMIHSCFLVETGLQSSCAFIQFTDGVISREEGNIITLIMDTAVTFNFVSTSYDEWAALKSSVSSIITAQYDAIQFVFYDGYWYYIQGK